MRRFSLIESFYDHKRFFLALVRRDLTSSYAGSALGHFWAFLDPLMYVVLTLFFFQFAIKGADTGGVPYVAWVLPQIIFWTFISGAINANVGSIKEYSFLMRHGDFDLRLVPIIKIASGLLMHGILMTCVIIALAIFLGVSISVKTFSLFYYLLSMCALLIAVGWLVSAVGVFLKDLRNIVSLVLQVEFWISPIFWSADRFPTPIAILMYINPLYYPMNGYRQSIIHQEFGPFFWILTFYFWGLTFILLFISSKLFKRMSRSFGDVI